MNIAIPFGRYKTDKLKRVVSKKRTGDPSEDLVVFFPDRVAQRWRLPFSEIIKSGLPLTCRIEERSIKPHMIKVATPLSVFICGMVALIFYYVFNEIIAMAIAGVILAIPIIVPLSLYYAWATRPRALWIALYLPDKKGDGYKLQGYEIGRMRRFWAEILEKEARKAGVEAEDVPSYTRGSLWNLTRMRAARNWLFTVPISPKYEKLSIGLAIGFLLATLVLVVLLASEISKGTG